MAKIGIIRVKNLLDGILTFVERDYILNTNLQGVLSTLVANSPSTKKKLSLLITGTDGRLNITDVDGDNHVLTFNTSINQSIVDFVTDNIDLWDTQGVTISTSGNTMVFESKTNGFDFTSPIITDNREESFLLRCFDSEDVSDGIDYKLLAIEIFTRSTLDRRKIETRLLFDKDRATLPTIHVREPAKIKGKQDAIGYIDEDLYENEDGSFFGVRRRSFDSQFELLITSMNRHEVIIIDEVISSLLIAAQDTLALHEPFYAFNFSTKELIANNELIPEPLFIKSIMMNLSYDKIVPDLSRNELLTSILFEHNILSQ